MKRLLSDVLGDGYGKISQLRADGQVCYKAQDICRVLGIQNTSLAVKGNLRIGYFGIDRQDIIRTGKSKTSPLYVSEAGMFKLILKSKKPAAYMIKVKLSTDVLPAIMHNGSFVERQADNYEEVLVEKVKSRKCGKKCEG